MDAISIKRAKEKEKKRKQREKLKQDKEKQLVAQKKDAERKRTERQKQRENLERHPHKLKAALEKTRRDTAERVRKHRQKKCQTVAKGTPNHQTQRRLREKHRLQVAESRQKEEQQKERARDRVKNFRLRIKYGAAFFGVDSNSSVEESGTKSPIVEEEQTSAYKHRSSASRPYKRVRALPESPAKKVRIIETIVTQSTPRSRKALSESPSLQAVFVENGSRRKLETQYEIMETLKSAAKTKRKSTVSVVANKLLKKSRNISSTARMLGISRKYLARKITNQTFERKQRTDKVCNENIVKVQNFYLEDASREMPNKRDVLMLSGENGQKVPVQKHMMELTQGEASTKFKEINPDVKIGQRKFNLLKPTQVRQAKVSNRVMCCCTYCENVRLKVQALNQFSKQPFRSRAIIVDSTMCCKTGSYHQNSCIKRQCENCGTKKLRGEFSYLLRDKGATMITWKEWEKCTVPLDEDRHVTRVILSSHEEQFSTFFYDHLCPALEPHTEHIFRASWQFNQFRDNVNNLQEGELVMTMDFAENYTCRHGREIQSFHWCQKQITIHPMMLYYKENGETQKEGYIAITDDLKHDASAVSKFEKEAIEHVRDNGIAVTEIHQWTDGCASQYKGRHSFAAISCAENTYGASVIRNYFESSHGKGPSDGLGGIVKRRVSNAVIQNPNLSIANAAELHQYCEENLKNVGQSTFRSRTSRYVAHKRTFKLVEKVDRSSTTTAKTLTGSRKLHSVASMGHGYQLKVRGLSCYCDGCRNDGQKCSNSDYVDQWKPRVLKTVDQPIEVPDQPILAEKDPEVSDVVIDNTLTAEAENMNTGFLNGFVAVKFVTRKSKICFFAKVINEENEDVRLEYLEKNGEHYQYPVVSEESWLQKSDIVCTLPTPESVVTGSRVKCV